MISCGTTGRVSSFASTSVASVPPHTVQPRVASSKRTAAMRPSDHVADGRPKRQRSYDLGRMAARRLASYAHPPEMVRHGPPGIPS